MRPDRNHPFDSAGGLGPAVRHAGRSTSIVDDMDGGRTSGGTVGGVTYAVTIESEKERRARRAEMLIHRDVKESLRGRGWIAGDLGEMEPSRRTVGIDERGVCFSSGIDVRVVTWEGIESVRTIEASDQLAKLHAWVFADGDRTLVTGNAKDARAPEPWQFMIHPQPPTDVQRWVDNITRWAELSEGHGSRSDAP